jgi:hypothetical protein
VPSQNSISLSLGRVKVTLWRCTDVWSALWRFPTDADRRLIDAARLTQCDTSHIVGLLLASSNIAGTQYFVHICLNYHSKTCMQM